MSSCKAATALLRCIVIIIRILWVLWCRRGYCATRSHRQQAPYTHSEIIIAINGFLYKLSMEESNKRQVAQS